MGGRKKYIFQGEKYINQEKKYINQGKKYIFPATIYVFPSLKYVFFSLIYLFPRGKQTQHWLICGQPKVRLETRGVFDAPRKVA